MLRRIVDRVLRRERELSSGAVSFEGFELPPPELRFCGDEFKDDAYYLKSARLEAQRLIRKCGLARTSRVLDIGCGPGRLAIGIQAELGAVQSYCGLDVHGPSIEWCTAHIARQNSRFRFQRLDVRSDRYNPNGRGTAGGTRLPLPSASCDVVNLYSVFSHMPYRDVVGYTAEIARALAPEGSVFLTAFVEEAVPNFEINPAGYRQKWIGPLHCVRFEKSFFENLLFENGLKVTSFEYGRETNGQSAFYLARAS